MIVTADTLQPPPSPTSGVVQVLFFGRIADACGRSIRLAIPSHGCSFGDLRARLADQVEGGRDAFGEPCLRVAIDQVMAGDDAWVSPGQEVAFLSAFSGG